MVKVAYLGPIGTYTGKAAARKYKDVEHSLIPFKSLPDIFRAVREGHADTGVVPIENSIEGSVNQTLDLLVKENSLKIVGEIIIQVEHVLMARQGIELKDIKKVISHGQALAQCSAFLEENLPWAEVIEAVSTAEAAARVSESLEPMAAIGNEEMVSIYNLQVLKKGVANCSANKTRFIVIAPEGYPVQDPNKTSILVSLTDRPGGLYQVLKEFALRNINLTKIESRPAKNGLGNYFFFIDFLGHPGEELVMECLGSIKGITSYLQVLGSYPTAGNQAQETLRKKRLSLEQIREDIDIIDRQIVELLAKRTQLVNIVGDLKGPRKKIRDKRRESQVLKRLTVEAENKGVSPDLIKRLYGIVFDHFVDLQESKRKKKLAGILRRKIKA